MKPKPKRVQTTKILETLQNMYPEAKCELNFRTPFELLIATILSAQCTDKRVNEITEGLFAKYNKPEDYLHLTEEQMQEEIRGLGLYKNKSRNILATCRILYEKYNSEVPKSRKALEDLPGVGRKTANVVLSNAFGVPAIAVDTHVQRVSNRLALADSENPLETERQLMRKIPRLKWSDAHHWLIWHGRRICVARKPRCLDCDLLPYCWYGKSLHPKEGRKTNESRHVHSRSKNST